MAAKEVSRFRNRKPPGFSFLELVVVLAALAVLMTIAVPSYREYVQRAERAEAIRQMLDLAACQERVRAENGFYDTTRCLDTAANDDYTFQIEPTGEPAARRFTIVAAPYDNDENRCGNLSLDHTGARGISGQKGSLFQCWGGR